MYHEFSCYKKEDGSTVCKGFGRDPDSDAFDAIFGSVPGVILNGAENFATAKDSFKITRVNLMTKISAWINVLVVITPTWKLMAHLNTVGLKAGLLNVRK
jgi:hypothetical protein